MLLSLFKRAWKGEASLAAAFWIIYFLIGIVIVPILLYVLANWLIPVTITQPQQLQLEVLATAKKQILILLSIWLPYMFYSAVCIWRCGRRSWGLWRFLSRLIVTLSIIGGLMSLYVNLSNTTTTPDILVAPAPINQAATQ